MRKGPSRIRLDHVSRLQLDRFYRLPLDHEDGFTLIELLVVIIIIGILAAIAIPVFLNQRQKGYDAGIKSDVTNAATAEETYLTDFGAYTKSVPGLTGEGFKYSNATDYGTGGQNLTIKLDGTNKGYCVTAVSASGKTWAYDSELGGLQTVNYTCPTQYS